MFTGFLLYTKRVSPDMKGLHLGLALANGIGFFSIIGLLELKHRQFLKKFIRFEQPPRVITSVEFDRMILEDGAKLVLLDDMVIDLGDFINKHPGGRFHLE